MMVIIHNGTLWRERHILFRSELFTFLKPSLHACISMSAQCDYILMGLFVHHLQKNEHNSFVSLKSNI